MLVKIYNGESPVYKPTLGANPKKTAEAMNIIAEANNIDKHYDGVNNKVSWNTLYKNRRYCPLLMFSYTTKSGKTDSHWVCLKSMNKKSDGTYTLFITDPTDGKVRRMSSNDFANNYAKTLSSQVVKASWTGTVY